MLEPGVLADVQTESDATQIEHESAVAGLEIALFVKDLVIGQLALEIGAQGLAPEQHRGGIESRAIAGERMADNDGNGRQGAQALCQAVQSTLGCPMELRAQQQVLRRVAAQGEFGGDQHLGPRLRRARGGIKDAFDVAWKITNGAVDLGNGNAHDAFPDGQRVQNAGLTAADSYRCTEARISARAASDPCQPTILTHLPGSRSL